MTAPRVYRFRHVGVGAALRGDRATSRKPLKAVIYEAISASPAGVSSAGVSMRLGSMMALHLADL